MDVESFRGGKIGSALSINASHTLYGLHGWCATNVREIRVVHEVRLCVRACV